MLLPLSGSISVIVILSVFVDFNAYIHMAEWKVLNSSPMSFLCKYLIMVATIVFRISSYLHCKARLS